MTPSTACASLIKQFETCGKPLGDGRFIAYLPTPQDRPTIGWGTTGPDIKLGLVWARAECDVRFAADLKTFGEGVAKLITGPTTQAQYDAMVCLTYNIGPGSFRVSTLLRMHNAGDHEGAGAQFADWNKQAGKVLAGLTTRRAAEAALYRS